MKFKNLISLLFLLALAITASAQRRINPEKQIRKAPGNAPGFVLLSDDNGQYDDVDATLLPYTGSPGGSELVFAAEADVNPDSTCSPSLAEIANWNAAEVPSPHTDAVVYYNCTDDSTLAATYVYYIDTNLVVILLESPDLTYNSTRRVIPSPAFANSQAPLESEVWTYIQNISPPAKPGTLFVQGDGAIPMRQLPDNPATTWFYDGVNITRIKDFPRKVEIPDNAFADTLNQTVAEVYTWLSPDTTYRGNYWLIYNIGAGTRENPDWVYSVNGDYSPSFGDILCIKKPTGITGNGAQMFTTANNFVTFHPNTVPPIGALVWNLDQGALYRKYGVSSYFTITEPNGRLVKSGDRFFQQDTLDAWDWDLNAAAEIQVNTTTPDSTGYVDRPLNFGSGGTGGTRIVVVNNELDVSCTVNWDSVYHTEAFALLTTTTVPAACKIVYEFSVDAVDTVGLVLKLISSNQSAAGGGTLTGVDDQVNGFDPSVSGTLVRVAPDFNELPAATVASGDLVMIADVNDSNNPKQVTAGAIAALAGTGTVTGVTDQVNMLDISLNGTNIEIAPDIAEGTSLTTFDALDEVMMLDNGTGLHYKAAMGTYFGTGFVDFSSTQVGIGGEKGFTTELHWGAATLPAGINFGTSEQTTIGIKGGTIQPLAESVYQDFAGLVIESTQPPGGGTNTTNFIATGIDTGTPRNSVMGFKVRPSGAGVNVVETMRLTSSGTLFGNASVFSTGAGQGVINVPVGGIGFDGGQSNYNISALTSSGLYANENGNSNTFLSPGQNGWMVNSDSTLKYAIAQIVMTPAKIRRLHGYTYKLLSSDSTSMGVIAQEIQADFPEAVVLDSITGKLAVNPLAIAAIAAEAANNLQGQLDSLVLRGSAPLDFGSTAAGASEDLTITVTGAADGDPVSLGVPSGSKATDSFYTASVTSANTVTVTFTNNGASLARDPASGTFKVAVIK